MPVATPDELTAIDGLDRSGAEVVASSADAEETEDWVTAGADAFADLKASLRADLKAEILGEIARDLAEGASKPALAMRAHVAQDFIKEANPGGTLLKHYRCDDAGSLKLVQYDMTRLREYEDGTRPIPEDKDGNPKNILSLCVMRGEWINWLDGHCYVTTQNQIDNIERIKTLPVIQGGMPGIYEDAGGATWVCHVCDPPRQFADQVTHGNHMTATHGVLSGR